MTKRTEAPSAPPDPASPEIAVEIRGTKYRLYFDFDAFAEAERRLREAGLAVNLLLASSGPKIVSAEFLPAFFFAGIRRYQPETTWEQARGLVNLGNADRVAEAVVQAYLAAIRRDRAEEDPADPTSGPGAAPAATAG